MATAVRTAQRMGSAPWEQGEMLEALSDSDWGEGIGTAIPDLTDSTETVVLSICGRDRRLRIR